MLARSVTQALQLPTTPATVETATDTVSLAISKAVLQHALSFLDVKSLAQSQGVCRCWRGATRDQRLWRPFSGLNYSFTWHEVSQGIDHQYAARALSVLQHEERRVRALAFSLF